MQVLERNQKIDLEYLTQENSVQLKKISPFGERMILKTRHLRPPFKGLNSFAPLFKNNQSLLLLDIFADSQNALKPIGYKNWQITGYTANEGIPLHSIVIPQTSSDQEAFKAWGDPFNTVAFFVREEYRGNGIGSLLTAISLSILNNLGVESIERRGQTIQSKLLWRKFGIGWEKHTVPLKSALINSEVRRVIEDFL